VFRPSYQGEPYVAYIPLHMFASEDAPPRVYGR
jgi:hypothetical protein